MTNYIPEEFYTQVRDSVIDTIRRQSISRGILPAKMLPGGIGTMQYSFDSATEVSEAMLSYAFTDNSEDVTGRSREHIPIPILHKEFRIGRRDLAACQLGGYDIDTRTANSAAYRVGNLENEVVLDGFAPDDSNYQIEGIYRSANNSYETSADFGTAGNATTAVSEALKLLAADEIVSDFDLYINPEQYIELASSIFGTSNEGAREMPLVEELLGGSVIKSIWIDAGTGMLIPTNCPNIFGELVVAQDATVEMQILEKSKDLWGRVYECLVPVIHEPNAFCKLTDI